jgi:hypothetical protein
MFFTSKLLSVLKHTITMERNICPSPSFLSYCSVNAMTQHYVCCCLLEVLKNSPLTRLAFNTWVGRHARARSTDASFMSKRIFDTANLNDNIDDKGTFNLGDQSSDGMDIDDLINQDSPFVFLKKGSRVSTSQSEIHAAGSTGDNFSIESNNVRNTTESHANEASSKVLSFTRKLMKPAAIALTPISASNILTTKDTKNHDKENKINEIENIKKSTFWVENNLRPQLDRTVEFPLFLYDLQIMYMALGNILHVTYLLNFL